MNRRSGLIVLGGTLSGLSMQRCARAHGDVGPVSPPVALPDVAVTDQLGKRWRLRDGLMGHLTVVQTIFTGCSSICPVQGALFVQAQLRLAAKATRVPVKWLSISIDALGDTPPLLRQWLQRIGPAHPAWAAVVPPPEAVEGLVRGLNGTVGVATAGLDDHSDKVYLVDAQARLCWRTGSLPAVDELVRLVSHLAA